MTDHSHLTEDERQLLVDEALPADRAREADAHLASCAACANDVARLRDIMARYKESSPPNGSVDDLWPGIRSRIEQNKVIPLGSQEQPHRRRLTVGHLAAAGALAAGIMLTVVLLRPSHRIPVDTTVEVSDTSALQLVSDSVKSYEDEARVLLNRLEVQRAMMRPDARASMDRDLKVIDSAIGELKVAIQNDPRNAALRQLLASSYRQKIELLKRANNAT
jgi:hypothetical protein